MPERLDIARRRRAARACARQRPRWIARYRTRNTTTPTIGRTSSSGSPSPRRRRSPQVRNRLGKREHEIGRRRNRASRLGPSVSGSTHGISEPIQIAERDDQEGERRRRERAERSGRTDSRTCAIRVERTIGPKPVSSSRTTTLATKAVVTNMKKSDMIMLDLGDRDGRVLVDVAAAADLDLIRSPSPRRSAGRTGSPPTQKTGLRSW